MQNAEPVLEKKTPKPLWDSEILTDYLISARGPDQVIVNKKRRKKRTCRIVNFARVKLKEGEKRDKYQDLARELKTMKVTVIPIITE